jgi:hypothetical protein
VGRDERDNAEPANDEGEHAENERGYSERTCAPVEDVDPTAVIGDDEPARIGEHPGFRSCVHDLQRAIYPAASVHELLLSDGVSAADAHARRNWRAPPARGKGAVSQMAMAARTSSSDADPPVPLEVTRPASKM